MGKTIRYENRKDLTVTAVFKATWGRTTPGSLII